MAILKTRHNSGRHSIAPTLKATLVMLGLASVGFGAILSAAGGLEAPSANSPVASGKAPIGPARLPARSMRRKSRRSWPRSRPGSNRPFLAAPLLAPRR